MLFGTEGFYWEKIKFFLGTVDRKCRAFVEDTLLYSFRLVYYEQKIFMELFGSQMGFGIAFPTELIDALRELKRERFTFSKLFFGRGEKFDIPLFGKNLDHAKQGESFVTNVDVVEVEELSHDVSELF